MTKIKFIAARFADPDENELALKRRFERHLRKPRAFQDGVSPKMPGDFEDELRWNEDLIAVHLSEKDRTKVLRRARRVMRARAEVSGLSHLSADDRRALEVFRGGADLVGIASDHRADEIAAAIHAEMPWMAAATDFLWKAMRRSVRAGEPGFRLPPVLLDGPPGIGKSVWSRELGRHLGVPRCGIEGCRRTELLRRQRLATWLGLGLGKWCGGGAAKSIFASTTSQEKDRGSLEGRDPRQ